MCQEVQELKDKLTMLMTLKNIYFKTEYRERMKILQKKWVELALTHDCSNHNNDKMNITISLN